MIENTVMVPITARYDSYKCDRSCEHLRCVLLFRCDHFHRSLANIQLDSGPIHAVRCEECLELFGGLEDD